MCHNTIEMEDRTRTKRFQVNLQEQIPLTKERKSVVSSWFGVLPWYYRLLMYKKDNLPEMIALCLPPNPAWTLAHTSLFPTKFNGASAFTMKLLTIPSNGDGASSPTTNPWQIFLCLLFRVLVTVNNLTSAFATALPELNFSCHGRTQG